MSPLRALFRTPEIGARAITGAFAIVVVAVFLAATDAVQFLGASQQAAAVHAAADARAFVRLSRVKPDNPRLVADGLAVRLAGSGLDVQLHGPETTADNGLRPRPELAMTLVAFVTGVHPVRVFVTPYAVDIGPDVHGLATMAKRIFASALILIAVIGLVMFALFRALNRAAMRPLVETTAALRRLAARDFTPRPVDAPQRGAIGELARAYTEAAATVATALEERRVAEAEMQRFIADAGHELKTPLTIVMGFVDVLERGELSPQTSARLYAGMRAETSRMRGMIENLIVLARLGSPDAPRRDIVDAALVADAVVEHLSEIAAPRRIDVVREGDAAFVVATENDLYDAIFNCAENALKYGDGSDVAIAVRGAGGRVAITVSDRGPGMPDDDRRRAFERFYRGERTRGLPGSGLGLSIVKGVIEKFNGTVTIESTAGGTAVCMQLPAVPDAVQSVGEVELDRRR
jgi:signal transduction histidine kinase